MMEKLNANVIIFVTKCHGNKVRLLNKAVAVLLWGLKIGKTTEF